MFHPSPRTRFILTLCPAPALTLKGNGCPLWLIFPPTIIGGMAKPIASVINWLMEGDPTIRWQLQRDLLDEKPAVYEKERAKVATQGSGKRYLAKQDKTGVWGNGLYAPKWISTFYTLWTLRFIGLPPRNPQALKACRILMEEGFRPDHGIDFSGEGARRRRVKAGRPAPKPRGRGETCETGMALAMFSHFQFEDERIDLIAEHLLEHQMSDHGWNCRYPHRGPTHASFNTTLLVLEGLREYQNYRPKNELPIGKAMETGREFLLQHKLYRSHRTGTIVSSVFTRFPAQPTWRYNFLSALDHFQAAQAPKDKRLQDPIDLLLSRRDESGRWPEYSVGSGRVWFQMEPVGKPSRWNTLRALRVLKWWEHG